MLTLPRRLARPLGGLVLLAMLVPAQPAECVANGPGPHERMPCCSKGPGAGTALDAGCCRVQEGVPEQDQSPTSLPAARRTGGEAMTPVVPVPGPWTIPPNATAAAAAADSNRPIDALYLRLSTIRC
ncbi:MAG TPA: hypothetical protein VD833_25060 [Vicinamibacterales bacterium]|nr:hypothetical protein [Vicinamibacterales bacterium]